MAQHVAGDQHYDIDRQLAELKLQLSQPSGYPFDLEALRGHLQAAIDGRFAPNATFPAWMVTKVGGFSLEKLAELFKNGAVNILEPALDIMGKSAFKISAKPRKVKFAKMRVKDLGFTWNPTTMQLFNVERLKRFSLAPCEPEDAIAVRLADSDQQLNSGYAIGHQPITASNGNQFVFYVVRFTDGRCWLSLFFASPESQWPLNREVVFRFCQ